MAKINATIGGEHREVLGMFATLGGVQKRVKAVYVTQGGVYKQVLLNKPLQAYTWAEIAAVSESGQASHTWAIGDTKTVTTTEGLTFTAQIADFDHDDLTAGGKAGITFVAADLIGKTYSMNRVAGVPGGYRGTDMYLQHMPQLRGTMPAELLAVIKSVTKLSYAVSGDTLTPFDTDFWLPSARELSNTGPEDGIVYPQYSTTNNTIRIKYVYGTTTARAYWTRTQATSLTWARVTLAGAMSTTGKVTTGTYVPISFCI